MKSSSIRFHINSFPILSISTGSGSGLIIRINKAWIIELKYLFTIEWLWEVTESISKMASFDIVDEVFDSWVHELFGMSWENTTLFACMMMGESGAWGPLKTYALGENSYSGFDMMRAWGRWWLREPFRERANCLKDLWEYLRENFSN